jgi:photosystem II stability/assembly factor-like uncharacterized protein
MKSATFRLAFLPGVLGALAWLSPLPAPARDNLWTSHGPAGASDITGVTLDPANPKILYAVSATAEQGRTGIRKSLDGGQTWIELGAGDAQLSGLTCLAVDPSNPSHVYVGTAQGLVASSHDGGATWSKATVAENPISSIAVEPASGSVYAATGPTGDYGAWYISSTFSTPVSRSTDAGATWQATSLGEPRGVYALLADSLSDTLFTGTDFSYPASYYGGNFSNGGGVARTHDAGATWALPATDLGFSVTALAADPRGGRLFAATSSGQVLRSDDAGGNWTSLGKLPGTVAAIAVDPAVASTLYAGLSHGGVWRSVNGGASWRLFDSGLTSGSVRSLAIDTTGNNLYAGARSGVFQRELPAAVSGPCHPGDDHLCLLGSRFRVDLYAVDPRTLDPAPAKALPKGDRFGYFSFPTLTGDATLPEVFVKMLDATSLPGQGYWLFSSALTNVPYSLVVTDTASGAVQFYDGQAFCGTADTQTFPADPLAALPTGSRSTSSPLAAAGSDLLLLSGRFRITLSATDPQSGDAVPGVAIPQGDRFGYFSLPALTGDPAFPEVFVKMLDATSLPDGDFWLFQGGLTTLPYALTVTDSVTGAVKTYRNEPADPTRLCGDADTKVTTGPTPTALPGEWEGTFTPGGEIAVTAAVAQSGDRLEILIDTPYPDQLRFDGVLHMGTVTGVARAEYAGCQFEALGSGTANSSKIQLTFDVLSGTCGTLGAGELDLTAVPESSASRSADRPPAQTTGAPPGSSVAKAGNDHFAVVWGGDGKDDSDSSVFEQLSKSYGATTDFSGYFYPVALAVDIRSRAGTASDANGVLEPGEFVAVDPTWGNYSNLALDLSGSLSNFKGPAGGTYALPDTSANYGYSGPMGSNDCNDGSPDACYTVSVGAIGTRPATHWDGIVQEDLLATGGFGNNWKLHIGDSFTDVPRTHLFYRRVEALLHHGITAGCSATRYCPDDKIRRDEMALFLGRAIAHGGANIPVSGAVGTSPYNCVSGGVSLFSDVAPTDPTCKAIHYVAAQNVTGGCGGGAFCVAQNVTRAEMARFVARGLVAPLGDSAILLTFTSEPPVGGGDDPIVHYSCDPASPVLHFSDVAATDSFCKHVYALAVGGIVSGCTATEYCPAREVTRGEMAKFLSKAFASNLYGP